MQIRMEHVTKSFSDMTAVNDFNETFEEGKLTSLLGPSGCGKSTLLNMISGILMPTSGRIWFGDKDITEIPMEKRNVSIVFQNYALYPHMTALDNICFPLEMQKIKKKERLEIAHHLAELVKISDYLNKKPGQMSGGQQQRVAIARALAKKPAILLLDEPLSNLDARLRLEMRDEIRRIQLETKVTTIFVTHDQSEALSISDRIFLMNKGTLQQEDKPQNIYEDPCNMFVAKFMGNPPIAMLDAVKKNNGLLVSRDGTPIRYSTPDSIKEGTPLKVGIRAEGIEAASEDDFDFEAKVVEQFRLGKDDMATCTMGDTLIRLYVDNDRKSWTSGQTVPLKIRNRGFYLFDADTEMRIL